MRKGIILRPAALCIFAAVLNNGHVIGDNKDREAGLGRTAGISPNINRRDQPGRNGETNEKGFDDTYDSGFCGGNGYV